MKASEPLSESTRRGLCASFFFDPRSPESPPVPFTFAHPAAVLPLRRIWPGAFLALVLGSIAPDLPFFLPYRVMHALPSTHSMLGTLTVAPLLGFALLVVVVLLQPVLLKPLWGKHRALLRQELSPFRQSPVPWLKALPALCLGSLTHYACDAATHRDGVIVTLLPLMDTPLPPVWGYSSTVYLLLQYLSSLVGMAVLVWWYLREQRATEPIGEEARSAGQAAWLVFILLEAAVIASRADLRALPYHPGPGGLLYAGLTHFVADFVVLYAAWGLSAVSFGALPIRPATVRVESQDELAR